MMGDVWLFGSLGGVLKLMLVELLLCVLVMFILGSIGCFKGVDCIYCVLCV